MGNHNSRTSHGLQDHVYPCSLWYRAARSDASAAGEGRSLKVLGNQNLRLMTDTTQVSQNPAYRLAVSFYSIKTLLVTDAFG